MATGDFAQSNDCPASLGLGASCTIDVTFTPTSEGAHVDSLTITHNAAGSPDTVMLTGTGVAAGFEAAIPLAANSAFTVDVNPNTNQIYTSGAFTSGQVVTWIDGDTNSVVMELGPGTDAHVNPVTNKIYGRSLWRRRSCWQPHYFRPESCPIGVDVDSNSNQIWGVDAERRGFPDRRQHRHAFERRGPDG